MSRFFHRNIGFQGRIVRGVLGAILLIAGIIMADVELWICLSLVAIGHVLNIRPELLQRLSFLRR